MTNKHFQKSLACLALALMAESASAQLRAPSVGFVRGRDGMVRRLDGLSGNYALGAIVSAKRTLSATFGAAGGLIHMEGVLAVVDALGRESARFDAPVGGRAVLSGRLAYFEADRSLWSFGASALALPLAPFDGTVIAIGESATGGISIAVRRDDGVWRLRIRDDGSVASQEALPVDGSNLLLLGDGVVAADRCDVVYLGGAAEPVKRWRIGAEVNGMTSMGGGSVQVLTNGGSFAIRLDRDSVFSLPESDAGEPR